VSASGLARVLRPEQSQTRSSSRAVAAAPGGSQFVADDGNGDTARCAQVTADVDAVMRGARANHCQMISPGIVAENVQKSTGIMIAVPDGHARLLESTPRP
jgi:hypothetical protein